MNLFISLYLFITGLAFGSFTLAMVDRMKTKRDWVKGRSECEYCKHKLYPLDLVPVFSWLSTGGKCRYCKKRLHAIYPITEICVGLSFLASYIYWPYELTSAVLISQFIAWLLAIVLMVSLFIFDMRWFLLPTVLVRPLIIVSLIWAILDIVEQGFSLGIVLNYIFAVLVGAGLFWMIYTYSKGKWIGDGDIRLGVAIGLFTGSPLEAWLVIFTASLLGLVMSLPAILKTEKEERFKLKIPFGPLLIAGLFVVVLFGSGIIEWYKVSILLL